MLKSDFRVYFPVNSASKVLKNEINERIIELFFFFFTGQILKEKNSLIIFQKFISF